MNTNQPAASGDVTQADRINAADHAIRIGRIPELYREPIEAGEWDHTEDVQAFARHRIAHSTPAGEREREAVARPWICFHCGEAFTDEYSARLHFGRDERSEAACVIKLGAERSLLKALRRAEEAADDAIQAMHSESTDAAKAYHAQRCRQTQALIAAEELGYERGLADGRALPPATQAGDGAEAVVFDAYDAGLLSDFGGGNVEWWQDYIRAELDRAHDHYEAQLLAPPLDTGAWKVVPINPTDAMLDQGVAALESAEFVPPSKVWSAMLSAAPTPPKAEPSVAEGDGVYPMINLPADPMERLLVIAAAIREGTDTTQVFSPQLAIAEAIEQLANEEATPQPEASVEVREAVSDIAAERRRQIDKLGWTPEHDDEHADDQALPRAAACYALAGSGGNGPFWITRLQVPQQVWPYRWEWKPKDRRANLVRAGALIVAEIERLDRAALKSGER